MIKPYAASLLFAALITVPCVADALAQSPAASSTDDVPRERSVRIVPDAPDNVTAAADPPVSLARLDTMNAGLKIDNTAGLSLDLVPSGEVVAGSRIGFRITTKQQGYLILLDIDPAGRLKQIFPVIATETAPATSGEASSLIKPGKPMVIPQLGGPYAAFEFVAEPPSGVAMVVALLSDRPVQVVDLPDTPPPAFAPNDTLKYVRDQTLTLIVPGKKDNQWEKPRWSFDGKAYLIR
ncbi:MAG: peptidase and chymotrypsin/Hap [Tardiphaga sp.]|uniref:DUF4384 domain-containing protein n=1 Tax=Tardiphaga sp. TaxID=1926292 RepID=UPI00262628F5|nr:DUF4384 domain-containing protein [Tardiphaga sp.]MDB5503999.1 peptidase and chymotrypsin/Hap [Tardiphaga sp.]